MTQWVKDIATQPANFRSIPSIHMVEQENRLYKIIL